MFYLRNISKAIKKNHHSLISFMHCTCKDLKEPEGVRFERRKTENSSASDLRKGHASECGTRWTEPEKSLSLQLIKSEYCDLKT